MSGNSLRFPTIAAATDRVIGWAIFQRQVPLTFLFLSSAMTLWVSQKEKTTTTKKHLIFKILLQFHLEKQPCYLAKYNFDSEEKVLDLKGFSFYSNMNVIEGEAEVIGNYNRRLDRQSTEKLEISVPLGFCFLALSFFPPLTCYGTLTTEEHL